MFDAYVMRCLRWLWILVLATDTGSNVAPIKHVFDSEKKALINKQV